MLADEMHELELKLLYLNNSLTTKVIPIWRRRNPWTMIGSPHHLNSEFAFYTHSEQYPNVTTHFRILFCIFGAHSTSSQLVRTSEAYFGNFGPISDLRSLFRKLRTSKTCIPTFGYLRTTHPDHNYDL
jgi:hypothetical protein